MKSWPLLLLWVTLTAVALGFGLSRLPVESYPDASPLSLSLIVRSSGMTPAWVEREVLVPLERALGGAGGVDRVESTARSGRAEITVFFRPGTRPEAAHEQLDRVVGQVGPKLPAGTSTPEIVSFAPTDAPVVVLALTGDQAPEPESRVVDALLQVPGVADVAVRRDPLATVLEVRKNRQADTRPTSRAVHNALDPIQASLIAGNRLEVVEDAGASASALVRRGVVGLLIAVLVMLTALFALGRRRTPALALLVLGVSAAAGVLALTAVGESVNSITLLGFAAVMLLGLDNAVVIQENLQRHQELDGDLHRAARLGTVEIVGILVWATAAVVPMLLAPALTGGFGTRWLAPFALVLLAGLAASTYVSATALPALAASPVIALQGRTVARGVRALASWFDRLADHFDDTLAWVLEHRAATTGIAVVLLAVAAVLPGSRVRSLLPPGSPAYVEATTSAAAHTGMSDAPVRLELLGPDAVTLAGVAQRIAGEVRRIPGAVDVRLVSSDTIVGHRNGVRVLCVQADVAERPLAEVFEAIDASLDTIPLPPGYSVSAAGPTADQAGWFRSTFLALGLATALTFALLIIRFRSLAEPVAIALVLPAAAVGGLVASAGKLTLPAVLGIVVVAVVMVRHAMTLLICARRRRARGVRARAALVQAGRLRLRPMLVVTLAIVSGMVTLALFGGAVSAGFGMAAAGAALAGALAVLLVMPAVLDGLSGLRGARG